MQPPLPYRTRLTCIRSSPYGVAHLSEWRRASKSGTAVLIVDTIHFSTNIPDEVQSECYSESDDVLCVN